MHDLQEPTRLSSAINKTGKLWYFFSQFLLVKCSFITTISSIAMQAWNLNSNKNPGITLRMQPRVMTGFEALYSNLNRNSTGRLPIQIRLRIRKRSFEVEFEYNLERELPFWKSRLYLTIKTIFIVFLIDTMATSSTYLIMRILSGTLINTNLGHSTLIYLALINVACKFSKRYFKLTWKNETKLCEDMWK